jgi:hypothetical protein
MSIKKYNNKSDQICDRLIQAISSIIPEISKKTGWKDQVIRRWINGSLPGIDKVEELCQAANISTNWLITGIGEDVDRADIRNLISKARRILTTEGSVLCSALAANIYAFDAALTAEQKAHEMSEENAKLRAEVSELKKADQLQLTSGPDFSHPEHPNGLKIVSGGRS